MYSVYYIFNCKYVPNNEQKLRSN